MLSLDGKNSQALAQCDQVIKQNPSFAPAYHQRGLIYLRVHDTTKAADSLEESLRLDPKQKQARKDLGRLYLGEHKLMEASSLFGEAARANPDDADAQNDYGVVQAQLGDSTGAAKSF